MTALRPACLVLLLGCGGRTGLSEGAFDGTAPVDDTAVVADAPVCPSTPPTVGLRCDHDLRCIYTTPCGGREEHACVGGIWDLRDRVECPETCSPSRPPLDARCRTEGLACTWRNECGDVEPGVCRGGRWVIDVKPCGECPRFSPTPGSSCAARGTCVHTQVFGVVCTQACACERAGAPWVCGTPRCAD